MYTSEMVELPNTFTYILSSVMIELLLGCGVLSQVPPLMNSVVRAGSAVISCCDDTSSEDKEACSYFLTL